MIGQKWSPLRDLDIAIGFGDPRGPCGEQVRDLGEKCHPEKMKILNTAIQVTKQVSSSPHKRVDQY